MTSVLTTALSNVRSFSAACRSLPIQSINANTRQLLLNISRFLRRLELFATRHINPCSSGMMVQMKSYHSSQISLNKQCLSNQSLKHGLNNLLPGFYVRSYSGIKSVRGESSHLELCVRSLSVGVPLSIKRELVTIHFINRDGAKITVKARTGQNLLDVVVDNDVDIDGYGACEGTLSCSTCHLIFTEELFKSLPKPSDEELDMLDLAYGQTDMSRLGCQVILTKEMDGVTFVVPDGVSDARDA